MGQSGLLLPAEYQAAAGQGLLLVAGPAQSPVSQITAPVAAAGSVGLLTGTYRWCVTFITASGETLAGPETSPVVLASQQASLTGIPVGSAAAGVIARGLYRTVAGGAAGTEKLVIVIHNNTTTTYTDNLADASLGASLPSVDTAGVTSGRSPSEFAVEMTFRGRWNPQTVYGQGHIVSYIDGNNYVSTFAPNQGNPPSISAGQWQVCPSSLTDYLAAVLYAAESPATPPPLVMFTSGGVNSIVVPASWGISQIVGAPLFGYVLATGAMYYDTAGASPGEQANVGVDPATGLPILTLMS